LKKTILSVVLILALCLTVIGCSEDPEDEDPFPSNFPESLRTILKGMGLSGFIAPSGGNYIGYNYSDNEVSIAWGNGTQAMLDAYNTAWIARSVLAVDAKPLHETTTFNGWELANISFYDETLTIGQLSIPANSIVFAGKK